MKRRVAHALALWFGCGLVPLAPGTAGTLGAVPLWYLLRDRGPLAFASAALVIGLVGVWAAGEVARAKNEHDPQIVVIDEVTGVLVAWTAAPPTTAGLIAGFVLFRLFDQLKPWPARWAERRLPGGWGIVLDDVFAGAWAALVLVAARLTVSWA